MLKYFKKIITVVILVCFTSTQAFSDYAVEKLGPWLISDNASMGPRKVDFAKNFKPGAIGNGLPLIDMLKGYFPPEISPEENPEKVGLTYEKLREAVELAIELYLKDRETFLNIYPHKERSRLTESALSNLTSLLDNLGSRIYLFRAPVLNEENYLLGFSYYSNSLIGLDIDLIDKLYAISPKRLAQYVYHECVPEHLTIPQQRGFDVERYDHKKIYENIQEVIFGKDEVEALKNDLRTFITEKLKSENGLSTYTSRPPLYGEKPIGDILRFIDGLIEVVRHGDDKIPPGLNKFSFIRPVNFRDIRISGIYNIYGNWEFRSRNRGNDPIDALLSLVQGLKDDVALLDDKTIDDILGIIRTVRKYNDPRDHHNYIQFAITLIPAIKDASLRETHLKHLLDKLSGAPEYTRYESNFEAVRLAEILTSNIMKDERVPGLLLALYYQSPDISRGILYPILEDLQIEGYIPREMFEKLKRPEILTMEDMFEFLAGRHIKVTYSGDDEDCPHNQFCYTVTVHGPDGRVIYEAGLNELGVVFNTQAYEKIGSPKSHNAPGQKDWIVDTEWLRDQCFRQLTMLMDTTSGSFLEGVTEATAVYLSWGTVGSRIDHLLQYYEHDAPYIRKKSILRSIEKLDTEYTDRLIKNVIEQEKDPGAKYFLEKEFFSPITGKRLVSAHKKIKDALNETALPLKTRQFSLTDHEVDVVEAMEKLTDEDPENARQYFVARGKIESSTFEEYMSRAEKYLTAEERTILRWATMLHDIGKARGLDAERPHPQISEEISREILDRIDIDGIDKADKDSILWLVKNHDILGNLYTGERAPRCLVKEISSFPAGEREKMLFLLQLITLADLKGTRKGEFLSDEKARFYLDNSDPREINRKDAHLIYWRVMKWTGKIDGTPLPGKEQEVHDLIDKNPLAEKIKMAFGIQIGHIANAFYTFTALSPQELVALMEKVSAVIPDGTEDISLEFTKPRGGAKYMVDELKNILNGTSTQSLGIELDRKNNRIVVNTGKLKTGELEGREKEEELRKKDFFTDPRTMVRAQRFKQSLISILEKDPNNVFVIGIDSDIGQRQKAQIMPLLTIVTQLQQITGPDGKPAFPNLKVVRRSAENGQLAEEVKNLLYDRKTDNIYFRNCMVIASETNYKNEEFSELRRAVWLSVIYDHPQATPGEDAYIPILEAVTITAMAASDADFSAIMAFYNEIAKDPVTFMPVTEIDLRSMIYKRIILLLPKMTHIPLEDLRVIYERTAAIQLAA
jgi:hypothetical protein